MHRTTCTFAFILSFRLIATAQSFLPPEPFGGEQSVKWLMEQELRIPEDQLAANVEGTVELTFTVRADGSMKDVRVTRSMGPVLDAEVLRVARLLRWHPASVGGSALDTERKLEVPISSKRYRKARSKASSASQAFLAFPADSSGEVLLRGTDSLAAPQIPKGLRGLPTYLGENLRYPEDARRRDMQGKVGIEFVVEVSGSVSNLRTVEALGAGCDEEAMRLIRTIAWKPAFKSGKRVRSVMKMDIQFRLDANSRP